MKSKNQLLDILKEFEFETIYFKNKLDGLNSGDASKILNEVEINYLESQISNNQTQMNLIKWVLDSSQY